MSVNEEKQMRQFKTKLALALMMAGLGLGGGMGLAQANTLGCCEAFCEYVEPGNAHTHCMTYCLRQDICLA